MLAWPHVCPSVNFDAHNHPAVVPITSQIYAAPHCHTITQFRIPCASCACEVSRIGIPRFAQQGTHLAMAIAAAAAGGHCGVLMGNTRIDGAGVPYGWVGH